MSNVDLNEILEGLDLESYLDHMGIDYRVRPGSKGRQLNLKECPGCGNTKWKVYASEETGLGNCFAGGCSLGTFNKYGFVRAVLGSAPHREVISHLVEVAGALGWRPKRAAAAVSMVGEVKLPNSIELPTADGTSLAYLEDRGVTGELASYFGLRYCHAGAYEIGPGRFQDYSGRVIIPVFDLEGQLRTFQGRDITGTKEPKYQFPPGLSGSGRYLYNGQNAWRAEHVVVGEGAFDVIAIHKACQEDQSYRGIATVGTFGMHLSRNTEGNDQIGAFMELMGQRLRLVTLMWDAERAALKEAMTAAEKLRSIGLKVHVALLPKDKDPNEVPSYIVREAISRAVDTSTAAGARQILKSILF
jgi:DNA primase